MARTPMWRAICEALRDDIANGQYPPGERLPTEAVLSQRFAVNRHTVRRALAQLVEEQIIYTRRGSGAYVLTKPTDYPLGRRVRFRENLLAAGRRPQKKVLSITERAATASEAQALDIPVAALVCEFQSVSLGDNLPIAVTRSVFPGGRLPGIAAALAQDPSVTEALRLVGVGDYTRASTRMQARRADATAASHLQVEEGAPLLYTTSVNVDGRGNPVEFGKTWFAGDRVTLTLGEEALDDDV